MTTFTRIRRIAAIGIALVLAAVPTSSAFAGAVGALSVTYANGHNGTTYTEGTELRGIWSNYNGSEPPHVRYNNGTWTVFLPDFYSILDPVVVTAPDSYAPDGTFQAKAPAGYFVCDVLTYAGNRIMLTIDMGVSAASSNLTFARGEVVAMTWENGNGELINVSHIWDGEHRESSTWFYFDDEGNLVTL